MSAKNVKTRDGLVGTIVHQSTGRYQVRVRSQSKDNPVDVKRTVTTRDDAEKLRNQLFGKHGKTSPANPERQFPTLTDYYQDTWLPYKTSRIRSSTLKKYKDHFELHIMPVIGGMPLDAITHQDAESVVDSMAGKGLGEGTIKSVWSSLRGFFNRAVKDLDFKNPMQKATLEIPVSVTWAKTSADRPRIDLEELSSLLVATKEIWAIHRALIWLGFSTGMGFSEMSALDWSDVDFDRELISINKSQTDGNLYPPKNRHRKRKVYLFPQVAELLRRLEKKGEAIFLGKANTYLYPESLHKPILKVCDLAGVLKPLNVHDMRRCFNAFCVDRKIHPVRIKRVMGHTLGKADMTYHYDIGQVEDFCKEVQTQAVGSAIEKAWASYGS